MTSASSLQLFPRACPLCASNDKSGVFAPPNFDASQWEHYSFSSRKLPENAHFRLILCPVCDALYADPIPDLKTLFAAYVTSDFDSGTEASYASRTYAGILKRFLNRLPDRAAALDVGTGDGCFLERLLELGFMNVVGVEPSKAPIASAKKEIRPLIREGMFRVDDFADNSLTLISCFQTFEHLYDPAAVCRDFYRLLKPGGGILFVFHNRKALSARIMGFKSPIFDVEHMQLFSHESATYMLKKCGFREIRICTVVNRYPIAYWMRLLPLPNGIKESLIRLAVKTGIGRIPFPLPAGNFAAFAVK